MAYLNRIKHKGVEFDLHDTRLDDLTPSSIGAAPLEHTHDASDISGLSLNSLTNGVYEVVMPNKNGTIATTDDFTSTAVNILTASNQYTTRMPVAALYGNGPNYQLGFKSTVVVDGSTGVLYGAAWNDFAEFRKGDAEPGYCVCEVGDGTLKKSNKRLQKGASIVSDTYGMVIGNTEGTMPIAVAGRVLAYCAERSVLEPGDAVCAAPSGKVDKMTQSEIRNHPDRILGFVSEIPEYEDWNGRKVNGRVWIKVK